MRITTTTGCWALALTVLLGCGSKEPSDEPPDLATYYPMKVGNWWAYDELDSDGEEDDVFRREITSKDTVKLGHGLGSRDMFVHTITFPGADKHRSYYLEDDGTEVRRARHEFFNGEGWMTTEREFVDPVFKFDRSKRQVGESWSETTVAYYRMFTDAAGTVDSKKDYWDTGKEYRYTYTLVEGHVDITVPAGTFDCAAIRRVSQLGGSESKTYYWAAGVGKVMEIAEGGSTGYKQERLTDYSVAGQ